MMKIIVIKFQRTETKRAACVFELQFPVLYAIVCKGMFSLSII